MASLYHRNGWFWLSYYEGGCRKRSPLHTKDKKIANFKKNEIENKLARGDSPLPDRNITLKEAFEEFLEYSAISNRPRTVVYYEETLDPFFKTLPAGLRVHQFRENFLTDFIKQHPKIKEGGAWHLIKATKTFLNFCLQKKYLNSNPVFIKKPALPKRVPECWSHEEIKRVLKHAQGPVYDAIFINLYLGLRPSELARLRWSDVDFKTNLVTVREAKDNHFRRIPLHKDLCVYLKRMKKTDELIIPGMTEGFRQYWSRQLRKNLKITTKRLWYAIRHTFATEYYKQTGDLKGLQEILGHSKIEMTTVYVNPQQDHQHQQLNKLSYG